MRASPGECPLCGPTLFIRFFRGDFGVRCGRCGAARNTVALVHALKVHAARAVRGAVIVNSRRGPFLDWLKRTAGELTTTAYIDGAAPGAIVGDARHEDLQSLTFADGSADAFVNQEVFEHVVDDRQAFREVFRVLRPAGVLAFTVPLEPHRATTLERARLDNGGIIHLTEPEYHDEPNGGRILAFRSYGDDVVERLREAGFARAFIDDARLPLGSLAVGRGVVIAIKG